MFQIPPFGGMLTNRCARMRVRGYIRILILSIHPFFPPDPGGCRGYADVAQLAEHRARRYAQVQVLPSAPNPKADSVQGQYCGKPILGERCVPSAGRGSAKGRSICPR